MLRTLFIHLARKFFYDIIWGTTIKQVEDLTTTMTHIIPGHENIGLGGHKVEHEDHFEPEDISLYSIEVEGGYDDRWRMNSIRYTGPSRESSEVIVTGDLVPMKRNMEMG